MRLPSKVTPFKDSILSILPLLLNEIKNMEVPPMILYEKIKSEIEGVSDFLIALDCLYALNKIK
jgi:hypothetical protein